MNSSPVRLLFGLMVLLSASTVTFAQRTGPRTGTPAPSDSTAFGSIVVYLRTEDGNGISSKAVPLVRVTSSAGGIPLPNVPTQSGDGWIFTGLATGNDYEVQVTAIGYLPARETVSLPDSPGASSSVIVFMRTNEQELVFRRPTGQFILTPKAEKEIQRALQDLQSGRVWSAQKHAQKAIELAPSNPYVQYVMGVTYLLSNQPKDAKPFFEKSVSVDPRQSSSLTALGTVRHRLGDDAGAVEVLTKAVQLDPNSWKAEWLLAASYLSQNEYQEARDHASQALKVSKQKAGQVQVILGQALAGLGEREAAAKAFESFATQYPKDPNARQAIEWARLMREPAKPVALPADVATAVPSGPNIALVPVPAVEVPPRANWAPPDIDAVKPFLVSTATCPLEQILKTAGTNAEELVTTLQEFSAKEDFQGIEVKRGGQLERPDERAFTYLVFIDQVSPQAFDVQEFRNEGTAEARLPGRLEDTGVPAMALAFHPIIQPNLEWKCEGLGTWNDHPAWVLHFEQRPNRPNALAWFSSPMRSYSLPLKGRAWVSERGSQVLHLETDLVGEIRPIDLKRQHFSIDYGQVSFRTQKVDLWLPENVDTYIQYQGHFLHYYHHFSDFKLFWVGVTQKISDPKDTKPE